MDFGLVIIIPQKGDKNEKKIFKLIYSFVYNDLIFNIMPSELVR